MSMIAFDTLKLARRLEKAGMPQQQAEAIAEAEAEALTDFVLQNLATKSDIAEVKKEIGGVRSELKQDIAELHQEIAGVRSELKQDIAELHQEIAGVRSELKQDIAELRSEVSTLRSEILADIRREITTATRWNVGTMIALVALTLAVLRLTG